MLAALQALSPALAIASLGSCSCYYPYCKGEKPAAQGGQLPFSVPQRVRA